MNGWLIFTGLGSAVAGVLWLSGISRALWSLVGAALMLAAAGFAWQSQDAGLPGHPVSADAEPVVVRPEIIALRGAMLGNFTGDAAYLTMSDALMRSGSKDRGTKIVLMGVNAYPRSLTLWTGLGSALTQHDGSVSPAARLAFDQATRLAPEHPAPPFFEGLAYAQSGDLPTARKYWMRAFHLSPKDASYRRDIALNLLALDIAIARASR